MGLEMSNQNQCITRVDASQFAPQHNTFFHVLIADGIFRLSGVGKTCFRTRRSQTERNCNARFDWHTKAPHTSWIFWEGKNHPDVWRKRRPRHRRWERWRNQGGEGTGVWAITPKPQCLAINRRRDDRSTQPDPQTHPDLMQSSKHRTTNICGRHVTIVVSCLSNPGSAFVFCLFFYFI